MSVFRSKWAGYAGATCVGLGLVLGGCDSADRAPSQPETRSETRGPIGTTDLTGSSDFDRELIAAKRGGGTNAERMAAIEAVLSKYGFQHSNAAQTAAPQPGPVASEAASGPSAKAAAGAFTPVVRNFTVDGDLRTFRTQVNIAPRGFLTVTAVGSAGTDPFLVAFYGKGDPVYSYPVTVAAYNDDISTANRNSTFTWRNPTVGIRKVEIVAFNYYPYNRGTALINITANGVVTSYQTRNLGGHVMFNSDAIPPVPGNCYLNATIATETHLSGFAHYPVAALVVDTKAMKGGIFVDNKDLGSQTLSFAPLNNDYPSFALIYDADSGPAGVFNEEPSSYRYKQVDSYSCVN
jgi:hypothetical protein